MINNAFSISIAYIIYYLCYNRYEEIEGGFPHSASEQQMK